MDVVEPREEVVQGVEVDEPGSGGSGSVRRGDNVLEKGDTTSNPTLKNVELMNSTTHLNVNVPGGDSLEVLMRWDILSHHRVGAESFSSPSGQADHPMEPKKFRLAMRLRGRAFPGGGLTGRS